LRQPGTLLVLMPRVTFGSTIRLRRLLKSLKRPSKKNADRRATVQIRLDATPRSPIGPMPRGDPSHHDTRYRRGCTSSSGEDVSSVRRVCQEVEIDMISEDKLRIAKILRVGETAPFDPDHLDVTPLDRLEKGVWCRAPLSEMIRCQLATRTPEEDWKARNSNWSNSPFAMVRRLCGNESDG
jgi:hypothetical protein